MKNNHLYSAAILSALLVLALPAQAYHLDGLWRNDRNNITLRIESLEEGFRAKRIDQGIWYKYLTSDGYQFVDRYGNAYSIQSDNEIIWNEANSGRRIYFTKVENRRDENREYRGNRNERDYIHNDYSRNPWSYPGQNVHADFLNGQWIDTYRNDELEIECFSDGIRVRRDHSGWEKYYPDRYDHSYKDKYGNRIQLIDNDSIRWEGQYGRHDRIYHRASRYRNENCR